MKTTLLALLFAAIAGSAVAAEPDYRAINADATKRHILPRYAALAEATGKLGDAATAFCAAPAATRIAPLQAAWRQGMAAWQAAQHLRFGPVEYFNRLPRFAFWPDPRNVTQRQLAELFAKRDAETMTQQKLVSGSVAIQGFSALERELFDQAEIAKLAAEPFRCQWLKVVTANIAAMARDIQADWNGPPQDFATKYLKADGDGSQYHQPSEATLDLFKSVYTAVELVGDHKLARPLADKLADARPRLAESWRSEASLDNIRANLAAARDLYVSLEPGVPDAALRGEIVQGFDTAIASVAGVTMPLEKAVADVGARPSVEKLRRDASALKRLLAEKLAPALGLPLGFNALDGD
jgi:predicted lipoprotein